MSDVPPAKPCLNPDCTGKNPMKGYWCTAKECKSMRALAMQAKKADKQAKACAAVGVPVPAAKPADGGQCFELHSVHGVLDCDFPHLGGKALEKAPPDDPKELCFLVYGTFAATEDDFENDRGCTRTCSRWSSTRSCTTTWATRTASLCTNTRVRRVREPSRLAEARA